MGQPVSKTAYVYKAPRPDGIDWQSTDNPKVCKECKILLRESGKSTFVKRMMIHRGFDIRALAEYRTTICKNVLDSAGTLARVAHRAGVGALGEGERALIYAMTMGQPFSRKALLAKARSDIIDQQIMEDSKRFRKECQVLLLGLCGSGKRTIVKRMKIHHGGFDARELAEYRTTIYKNVLYYAGTLAHVVRRVGVGTLEESERPHATQLLAAFPAAGGAGEVDVDPVPHTRPVLTPALVHAIWHVARTLANECLLEHPTNCYSMDSAWYFFASIHRIAAPMYVPSEEDILHARTMSTAIIETRFWMSGLSIHIIDVGGQRSERKKWIHCFESVTSIIFCTALSDYDQTLQEERRVNRMRESLYLFESVINSRWFLRTSVILLLNKIAEFKHKLPNIPLERYFPEYTGGNDLQKAAKYILWKFMQEYRARLTVYPHITQATNRMNIRLVFAAVKETILQNALKDSGIL